MAGRHDPLPTARHQRLHGHASAVDAEMQLVDQDLHFDRAHSQAIGDAVGVATDRHHAIAADPALDGEHCAVRQCW